MNKTGGVELSFYYSTLNYETVKKLLPELVEG